jgi:hypothetical protein
MYANNLTIRKSLKGRERLTNMERKENVTITINNTFEVIATCSDL